MAAHPDAPAATVTLDIYSGRPNPEWTLSQAQTLELRRRLGSLGTPLGAAPAGADHLGYRGFLVTAQETEVAVARGTACLRQGASVQCFRDAGRALERWLLETGRGTLSAGLTQMVEGEIAKGG